MPTAAWIAPARSFCGSCGPWPKRQLCRLSSLPLGAEAGGRPNGPR
jgi:hypothetical protein